MSPETVVRHDEVLLVRHAETDWSRDGRHTGRTDIPLSEAGRAVAGGLRQRLRGQRFELVLVSPLRRARETCDLAGLGARAQPRPDLMEWDYGDYNGLTSAEIHAERPDWNLWRDGCPGGENAQDVGTRVDRVIAELDSREGPAAVFAHGHLLRVLGARWIALDPSQGNRLALSTAAICTLANERGTRILSGWNETGSTSAAREPL